MSGPETTQDIATHLRRMADNAGDQIDADRLSIAANLVDRAHLVAPDAPPDGGPAFPNPALADESFCAPFDMSGMSLRQYAAITLRVPNSGTDWLDDMIREGRRMDYAGQALTGSWLVDFGADYGPDGVARDAYRIADAMLAARGGK